MLCTRMIRWRWGGLLAVLAVALLWGYGAPSRGQGLSGDEILARAAERGTLGQQGSLVAIVDFEILNKDGSITRRKFAFFSKREAGRPERLLIYFLEPDLERGTIFLSIDPVDPAEKVRLWLYLPAFGQVKELVSEAERKAAFAGSNLQNEQIGGGFDFSEDYTGTLLGEEAVTVTWLGELAARRAFKVALAQKSSSDSEADFPSGTVWVDEEEFLVLRSEFLNRAAELEEVITLDDFIPFEGAIEPSRIAVENVLDGSRTTITILERRRVDLPDEIFTPEALPTFDPAQFGVG